MLRKTKKSLVLLFFLCFSFVFLGFSLCSLVFHCFPCLFLVFPQLSLVFVCFLLFSWKCLGKFLDISNTNPESSGNFRKSSGKVRNNPVLFRKSPENIRTFPFASFSLNFHKFPRRIVGGTLQKTKKQEQKLFLICLF